ncbi:MAG: hypothetical protein NUV76_12425 [Candidatus Kuenenia sp.]|nr:hypothetical protein [Candidatus Kuenenia sp.]
MENVGLGKIVEEGQKLAEKRTWVEKGYTELIEKINIELGKIPDMDEKQISYLLREYKYESSPTDYANYKRKVRCNLVFDGDAYLEMVLWKETAYNWEKEVINSPTVETIREFARKLPEMLDYFLTELQKSNEINQVAIDTMAELISKIQ